MTEIAKVYNDARQASRWKAEARRAAEVMKRNVDSLQTKSGDSVKVGFCFDDGVVTLELPKSLIRQASVEHLAAEVYRIVAASMAPQANKEGS